MFLIRKNCPPPSIEINLEILKQKIKKWFFKVEISKKNIDWFVSNRVLVGVSHALICTTVYTIGNSLGIRIFLLYYYAFIAFSLAQNYDETLGKYL